jgi:acetoin utilization deacetylase AcuC-like enzyme
MRIVVDERCTGYSHLGHPESPGRIQRTLARLRAQTELPLSWAAPLPVDEATLLRAHAREYLDSLKNPARDFDGDTPAYPDIYDHAVRAVGGTLQALKSARAGERAFSLMRPPGHHATQNRAMGFCYLSSAALAVCEALAAGVGKVAVYDFDVHHGNGTEAILLNRPGAAYFSIHQHPCYPGTGTKHAGKNCFNYPVPPNTPRAEYRTHLTAALDELKRFHPDLVVVSAGFDAYAHESIAQETLEAEDFAWLGKQIRQLEVPACALLEGGYSTALPDLILEFLKAWEGK